MRSTAVPSAPVIRMPADFARGVKEGAVVLNGRTGEPARAGLEGVKAGLAGEKGTAAPEKDDAVRWWPPAMWGGRGLASGIGEAEEGRC